MRALLLLPALALVSACAMDGPPSTYRAEREARAMSELDTLLAGYTAGKPQSCVENRNLDGPRAYGESTLIFRDGRTLWRTEAPGCDEAGRDALITRQYGGNRICRGDIARTADLAAGFQTGSCAFGDFVPYRKGG